MLIPFAKMQAQGNDFAILQLTGQRDTRLDLPRLAVDICDRRKGVGADGLVLLLDSPEADARMAIYNSDGSRAAMCGSALRCCSALLAGMTGREELSLATDSGIKTARVVRTAAGPVAEVNLGRPALVERDLEADGLQGFLVDVGNRHFVTFWDALSDQAVVHGPRLENHPRFPGGVNSEFVRVISPREIDMVVWERGCGITQACGTGAVASVFSGIAKELLENSVAVKMPGGTVRVTRLDSGEFTLAGGVGHSFSGVFRWKI